MTEFDAQTILNLAAALARNLAAVYIRRYGLPDLGGMATAAYEQQLVRALAPGLVAFVARLTTALPPDIDLPPILIRFCADPATAEALKRYSAAEADGARAVADALVAAGLPAEVFTLTDLEEGLAAWAWASAEVARLDAANNPTYQQAQQTTPLYHTASAATLDGWSVALRAMMAELVQALADQGLSRVVSGDVLAADGVTVIFSWGGRGDGPEEMAESAGPETMGESGAAESERETIPDPPPPPPPPPPPASELPAPPMPVLPAPALPPPVDEVVSLRLDAAAPPQVPAGLPFDLAVAIRQAASPPLAPDDLTQHESAPFAAVRPAGAAFIALRIQIAAPDCDIHGGDTRPVRLFPGQDGPTVYFQLTPRRAGPLSIIVTVYQETDWIGSTRLRTEAGGGAAAMGAAAMATAPAGDASPRAGLTLNVVSQPLGEAEVNLKQLRDALDDAYSDAELRDLCFELELDYEDLPGDGQAAKARELVLYCKRRGLLASLVACVMRDRPLLLGSRG